MTAAKTHASRLVRFAPILTLIALASCSQVQVGPDFATQARGMDPATFECCFEPEKFYPAPVAKLALALGDELGPSASALFYGEYEESAYPGLLTGKTEAHAAILSVLDPLDIVLVSNHSYLLGRLVPGRFSHALVYLGTEAELRRAGLWSLPGLGPYRERIRTGEIFIEAAWPAVDLVAPEKAFQTDRAFAVRPELTPGEKRDALAYLLGAMGTPFNYGFGFDPGGARYSCTELIHNAMPGLGYRLREAYGQTVLMPDDLAAQAVRGDKFRPLTYVVGREDGFVRHGPYAVMVDLASFWGVPGTEG